METDYYLHNLDVEIGKEMKGYQKSFGVLEWQNNYDTSTTDISVRRSRRIEKVRDRCRSQNRALSTWWKVALQVNVQQRMVSDDSSFAEDSSFRTFWTQRLFCHIPCSGCNSEKARQNPCYLHGSKGYISLKRWHNLIDSLPGLGLLQ